MFMADPAAATVHRGLRGQDDLVGGRRNPQSRLARDLSPQPARQSEGAEEETLVTSYEAPSIDVDVPVVGSERPRPRALRPKWTHLR